MKGALAIDAARSSDAVGHARAQPRQTPFRRSDADDRDLERPSFRHRVERREDHLVREIARDAEEHQRARTGGSHQEIVEPGMRSICLLLHMRRAGRRIMLDRGSQDDMATATTASATPLHALGQSLWLDNITRGLLTSGTLGRYIDEWSVTGLTSNPTIFDHAIETRAFLR